MSSDIITLLQIEKDEPTKVITIKEINNCNSSFITSCVLNHSIKNKNAVLIVSTHNSLMHFQQVGLKMNYSLQRQIDNGTVVFYNLGDEIVKSVAECSVPSLQDHMAKLKNIILDLTEKHQSVDVIVDGVTHLLDLDFTLKDVHEFCSNIISLSRSMNCTFICFHCNIAHEDDVTWILANSLSHKSQCVLEVENLPSGLSADVSGHLIVRHPGLKFKREHMFNLDMKPSKYLFKLFDRGVKLFAPGTV